MSIEMEILRTSSFFSNHAWLQVGFEVDAVAMLDEECHFALVVRALQVNVTGHKMRAAASRAFLRAFIDL